MDSFLKNIASISNAIDICLERGFALPALILIYSCIDILGSLEREKGEGSQRSFIRWVENYLLKAKPLDCTAIDLFSARCAVLHTLTSDSNLSSQGKARKVVYSWGTATLDDLKESVQRLKAERVSIHINDLHKALVLAIDQYLEEVGSNEVRRKMVLLSGGKSFNNLSNSELTDFLSNSG